jgi:hypothetical protein
MLNSISCYLVVEISNERRAGEMFLVIQEILSLHHGIIGSIGYCLVCFHCHTIAKFKCQLSLSSTTKFSHTLYSTGILLGKRTDWMVDKQLPSYQMSFPISLNANPPAEITWTSVQNPTTLQPVISSCFFHCVINSLYVIYLLLV